MIKKKWKFAIASDFIVELDLLYYRLDDATTQIQFDATVKYYDCFMQ